MIKENIEAVQANIETACQKAGRDPREVTLIAVSKTKPLSDIEEAIDCGMMEFGENKVQELVDKIEHVSRPVHWHLIGHLQTNKVKYIADKGLLIHSVDSVKLAKEIQKEAVKKQADCDILLEVNVAREESKFGFTCEEVPDAVAEIAQLSNVHIQGLMTIAPFVENPEDNRVIFAKLHKLLLDIKSRNIDNVNMNVLSMGMTNDYTVAVEEGATMVRVGTGIFGARNYNI
ncbi:MAG: YggS family pyridoxal phosphate-dependent enzyme [Clostridium sp.]|nr:YggS family pyridoxal phosphate-dependent enzyme [Clostridium sp.]